MSRGKMLILRGNSADAGTYPDEQGNTNVAWPIGALHEWRVVRPSIADRR
jgi:hypothetical protein